MMDDFLRQCADNSFEPFILPPFQKITTRRNRGITLVSSKFITLQRKIMKQFYLL